jgi:hypothetical protein
MRITSGGLVGINTSSPTNHLQVNGGISSTANSPAFQASAAIMDFSASTARFNATGADNSTQGTLTFNTASANAGIFNERMRITSAGNVGIGLSSPATILDINGVGRFRRAADNNQYTEISTGGGESSINFVNSGSATYQSLIFNSQNSGSPVERMRIDGSGNVLVGTTSTGPVNANAITIEPANSRIRIAHASTSNGTPYIQFDYNGGAIGSVTQATTATVAYNTSSDYRLKENITPMTGALAKVAQLKPVTYSWKVDGSDGQGFIAHELQEIAPYAVTGEKDGEQMQGVDYGKITPLLTAALQEALAKIESLEARLAVLESK